MPAKEAGYEGNVAQQSIQLGDIDRIPAGLPGCECRGELWSAVRGIGTFASLCLGELGDERIAFGLGELAASGLRRRLSSLRYRLF